MSSIFMPAFFSAWAVAGSGVSSITTGSPPMTVMWCTRARGCTPSSFRPRSLTTIRPAAPSQIWLALAAVHTPPSAMSLTPAMPSSEAS